MDPLTIAMLAVLAVLIFFMFRNNRKRKADLEKLQSQIVAGAEIMTNFGVFGTLLSIDATTNVAEVETSPGTVLRVHRQTITRVINPDEVDGDAPRSVEEAMARANAEAEARELAAAAADADTAFATEPEFGERTIAAEADADVTVEESRVSPVESESAPVVKKPRTRAKKTEE